MPAVWPGVCSALTIRPPISSSSPGCISPVRARARARPGATRPRLGVAREHRAELRDVIPVVVGEQDVGDVEAGSSAFASSGSDGPPASTRNASPPRAPPTR